MLHSFKAKQVVTMIDFQSIPMLVDVG